jgi:syntaxin 5
VARRKTLFDDRPIEISELTYIIRQDIASLNTQIAALQSYVRSQKAGGTGSNAKQVEEHNSNVVMLLQSRLANMGMGFKDVLELRTQVGARGLRSYRSCRCRLSMGCAWKEPYLDWRCLESIHGYLLSCALCAVRCALCRGSENEAVATRRLGPQRFGPPLTPRPQNMKASKDRTEQFMHTANTASTVPPPSNSE